MSKLLLMQSCPGKATGSVSFSSYERCLLDSDCSSFYCSTVSYCVIICSLLYWLSLSPRHLTGQMVGDGRGDDVLLIQGRNVQE